MYAEFFGLKQDPFSIAPDPRYLFMSERHRDALAHLLYGVGGGGGFVLVTGEIGTGKTTVCRCFLEQIPANCNVAYIFNPKLTVTELLLSVCEELHITVRHQGGGAPTVKECIDPLNDYLVAAHAAGRNTVLIIDEAQNLSADVLEQLRLLTNLETNERKLLQIVLIGQPELRSMLARPELEQLAQRVIARFHLDALGPRETAAYIQHRLAVAGLKAASALPFDAKALARVHQISRGVPRRINLLCGRALLGAYAHGKNMVTRQIVDKAASEVFDAAPPAHATKREATARAPVWAAALGAVALAGWAWWSVAQNNAPPAKAANDTGVALQASGAAATPAAQPSSAPAASTPTAVASDVTALLTAADLQTSLPAMPKTEGAAWQQLGSAWNTTLPRQEPCTAALREQLRCFKSSDANLAMLRQLNRPGIITLYDAKGAAAYAVVLALGEQSITLSVGEGTQSFAHTALAGAWRGQFATLWRAPSAPALAAQLEQLVDPATGKDAPLAARVAAFQLAHGLKPDGVAGPVTLMQLNRAAGLDEPRLSAP
jgi:general secretion pathway protein A